ncbi:hypothetical protein QN277_010217 [Acacia crassicarpa]|uniref:HTH myb-type domain-containing protein n=1 Tax=Acacia crassicarpa TaxID=499986 RepID=A0AAE1INM0_9FABA|nr:hypothetical protein QN277_010217 [Acacia crassicarpa]
MFPPKKASSMNSQERGVCVQPDSGLVLTTDPKPRLRWTVELHERFVDAVAQLGGPDKATPKTIMRVMGVNGLTLYHLKSHLQKFRLGKQPHKDFNDHSIKNASALELQRNSASSSAMIGRNMNEMQMEVQRRLHEQLEVQKHLQLRIEAQGKYMQSILEKAYQTLAGENLKNNINGSHHLHQANMTPPQDFTSSFPLNPNFASFQDQLNVYGGGDDQLDHHLHHHQFMPNSSNNTENLCVGMNNNSNKNKRPLFWNNEDLRLHHHDDHLGTASSSLCLDTDPFKDVSLDRITSSSENNYINIDPISDMYDTKPLLHHQEDILGDASATDNKKLFERPSPKRAHSLQPADQRMSPMISTGTPF